MVAVGVVLAVTCTLLGRWQWNRHVWRDAAIAVVQENYAADPVPLSTVLADPSDVPADTDEWRRVRVAGHYLPDDTVLLRNRPVDGNPAYHVLVPFVVTDPAPAGAGAGAAMQAPGRPAAGTLLVVDRGWVPTGQDASAAVTPPAPPAGTVTLTARLRPSEPESRRSAPPGQVQAIAVAQVLAAAGDGLTGSPAYTGGYVAMTEESPAAGQALGALPPPSTDPGSHLSYAFQWWTFALGGLVAFSVAARRELRAGDDDGELPAAQGAGGTTSAGRTDGGPAAAGAPAAAAAGSRTTPGRSPRRVRPPADPGPRRRGGRDEDDEDALIDAQLAAAEPSARADSPHTN